VGLLISAVAFYRVAAELPRSAPTTASGPNSPTVSASTSHRPSGTVSPKTAPTPTQPNGKLPNGPGTTEPGILLMASPLRDGSFDIAEIVLLTTPTSSIRLSPPQLTRAGSRFSKAKPIASQVQVSAGSQPVLVPDGRINQRTDLPLNASTKRVELRYRLSGITVRSMPSRAGRALTAIRPLVAGAPENLPVAMMVSGASVLNIECPVLRLSERACSIGEPPNLRVKRKLPWRNAVIVVQFDLPRAQ
jgi:hypothetical protein